VGRLEVEEKKGVFKAISISKDRRRLQE